MASSALSAVVLLVSENHPRPVPMLETVLFFLFFHGLYKGAFSIAPASNAFSGGLCQTCRKFSLNISRFHQVSRPLLHAADHGEPQDRQHTWP